MAKYTTNMDELYEMAQNIPKGQRYQIALAITAAQDTGTETFFTVPTTAVDLSITRIGMEDWLIGPNEGTCMTRTGGSLDKFVDYDTSNPWVGAGFRIYQVDRSDITKTATFVIHQKQLDTFGGTPAVHQRHALYTIISYKDGSEHPYLKSQSRAVHTTTLDEIYEKLNANTMYVLEQSGTGHIRYDSSAQFSLKNFIYFSIPYYTSDIYFVITRIKAGTQTGSSHPTTVYHRTKGGIDTSILGENITPYIKYQKVTRNSYNLEDYLKMETFGLWVEKPEPDVMSYYVEVIVRTGRKMLPFG